MARATAARAKRNGVKTPAVIEQEWQGIDEEAMATELRQCRKNLDQVIGNVLQETRDVQGCRYAAEGLARLMARLESVCAELQVAGGVVAGEGEAS